MLEPCYSNSNDNSNDNSDSNTNSSNTIITVDYKPETTKVSIHVFTSPELIMHIMIIISIMFTATISTMINYVYSIGSRGPCFHVAGISNAAPPGEMPAKELCLAL